MPVTGLKATKIVSDIGNIGRRGRVAHTFDQPYGRGHPMEFFLDRGLCVCEDSTFVLYRVDRARRRLTVCASSSYATIWSCPRHIVVVDHGVTWGCLYLSLTGAGKELAIGMGLHDWVKYRRWKLLYAGVLRITDHWEPYGSIKYRRDHEVCRQPVGWLG